RSGKPFSDGTIRLYLDDSEDPILAAPASQFIDGGPDGDGSAWDEPVLAYGVAAETPHERRGHNLFVPIPFAKACRITYETAQEMGDHDRLDESFYYHVGYRSYDPGTDVESFSFERWRALKTLRSETAKALTTRMEDNAEAFLSESNLVIGPGGRRTFDLHGSKAIRNISLTATALTPQQRRSTLIELRFDGVVTARVPLAEFFTAGYVPADFQTWMTGLGTGTYSCDWVMPFQRSASITFENLSQDSVALQRLVVTGGNWSWTDSSMHFHADWRSDQNLSTGIAKTQDKRDGVVDLGFLDANGKGLLVGDSIMLFSGAARWWGEGDEKIYVDGEAFPSHFGTGTEDYYGYAWCRPENFTRPFHAQPVGRGALLGGPVVNTRIRSLDAIPFRSSIDFDMELWHWSKTRVNYARTVFWYGIPGARSTGSTPELAAKTVALKDTDLTPAKKIPGAIEGESARVIEVTGGSVETDRYTLFDWSSGAQLLWKDAKPGDRLTLEFESLPSGEHDVIYTIGPDYGRVELDHDGQVQTVNGRFIGILSVLECRRVPINVRRQGTNRITFTIMGNGDHGRRFGLDALVPRQ
ncbi:MAG: glycoside hydrolase family 172 protein, partial [Planctomycetota bacterium]